MDLTASPFPISDEPFSKNIVDFSHLFNVEESVILTTFDDSLVKTEFSVLDVFDKWTLIVFAFIFVIDVLAFTLFDDYLLVKKANFIDQALSIIFFLFGTLCGKGNN